MADPTSAKPFFPRPVWSSGSGDTGAARMAESIRDREDVCARRKVMGTVSAYLSKKSGVIG
jgi:hypothetical protein